MPEETFTVEQLQEIVTSVKAAYKVNEQMAFWTESFLKLKKARRLQYKEVDFFAMYLSDIETNAYENPEQFLEPAKMFYPLVYYTVCLRTLREMKIFIDYLKLKWQQILPDVRNCMDAEIPLMLTGHITKK